MLKKLINYPLNVRSRSQKTTLWAYTQGTKKLPIECTHKEPKNYLKNGFFGEFEFA